MASAPMEGARAAAGFAPPPGERRGGEEGEPPHRAGSGDGEGRAAPAMGKKEIEGGRERVRRGDHRSGVCGGERRYVSTVGPTMCLGRKKLTGRKKSYGQPENQHREEKVYFASLNYCKSLIFLSQLQNRISTLPQLSKPFIFPPSMVL